jgi:acyl carrier protein
MILSREELLDRLAADMEELFEIPREQVTSDARLYEDLDLDSIDAVDLLVRLRELTGRRISPEDYKTVRTVGDVVDRIAALLAEPDAIES